MLKSVKALLCYFERSEKILWTLSVLLIGVSFFVFDRSKCLTLAASLIGVTSLISAPRVTRSTAFDDNIQRPLRNNFILLCALRRNADISRNDGTDGDFCIGLLVEESFQRA